MVHLQVRFRLGSDMTASITRIKSLMAENVVLQVQMDEKTGQRKCTFSLFITNLNKSNIDDQSRFGVCSKRYPFGKLPLTKT